MERQVVRNCNSQHSTPLAIAAKADGKCRPRVSEEHCFAQPSVSYGTCFGLQVPEAQLSLANAKGLLEL